MTAVCPWNLPGGFFRKGIGHQTDEGQRLQRMFQDGCVVIQNVAVRGKFPACHQAEQGGFACAIGANQPSHGTVVQGKGDLLQGVHFVKMLCEIPYCDSHVKFLLEAET